ncbi:NHL repeat containing protein [Calothrix sp. NIES-4071]|nr:NHL repeat containing protein [Calothrix sp. NIES-4071]BAZ60004.1 NHL repeat containing protein [Calothrix sp. NIES-4105]
MGLVKNLSLTIASAGCMFLAATSQAFAVTLSYDSSIGSPGFAPGQLFVPQGIGVQDSTNKVFISNGRGLNPDGTFNGNLGNSVSVFDSQGNYLRSIGTGIQGKGAGFDEPADLKFQPGTGELHVGDVFNSEIDVYNPNSGEYIRSYGSFGGPVQGRLFFGPGGMQFDKNGDLYITDFSQDVIKKYDGKTGDLVQTIGGPGSGLGQFSGPAGLNISQNTGNIYVTDQYNNRVQVLSPDGTPLFAFGSKGSEPGQLSEAIGIELDEQDNIYVSDSINSRVQVFDKGGNFLTAYGEPVRNAEGQVVPPPALGGLPFGDPLDLSPGKFNWTAGAHYDRGKLYVGDFFQGRVQVLNVDNGSTKVPEPGSLLAFGLLGLAASKSVIKRRRQRMLGEKLLAKVEVV